MASGASGFSVEVIDSKFSHRSAVRSSAWLGLGIAGPVRCEMFKELRIVSPSVFAGRLIERKIADITGPRDNLDSRSLPIAGPIIRHAGNIDCVTRHTDEPQVMVGDGAPAIFFGIRGLRMRHRDDRAVGDGALRIDRLSPDAADADKHEDTSHRPNETELSHRSGSEAADRLKVH